MIPVLGENYFIDLDKIEKYLDMSDDTRFTEGLTGTTEMRINSVKLVMVQMLLDTVLTEQEILDEKLGMKSNSETSIPFRLAFNSLLNKNLINYY